MSGTGPKPLSTRAKAYEEQAARDAAAVDLDVAQKIFRAYNDQGPNPWQTFDGRSVPTWDEISDQVRGKWIAAARKAREVFAE